MPQRPLQPEQRCRGARLKSEADRPGQLAHQRIKHALAMPPAARVPGLPLQLPLLAQINQHHPSSASMSCGVSLWLDAGASRFTPSLPPCANCPAKCFSQTRSIAMRVST